MNQKIELIEEESKFIAIAQEYATNCHGAANHRYDKVNPYTHHLQMAYNFGLKFCYLLPRDQVKFALSGDWTHDTIEDTRQTFNDVKKVCGEEVAEITYLLTNEKGRNRKERANNKYYAGIKSNKTAVFVKLCDRLANAAYSFHKGSDMYKAYQKENDDFELRLYTAEFEPMFVALAEILKVARPVAKVYGKEDKTNMEFLRDEIDASGASNSDDMHHWLDAVEKDHSDEVDELDEEIEDLKKEIAELEQRDFVDEDDDEEITDTIIQAGIGQIKYSTPGNLVLDSLMETLNDKIQSAGPQKILTVLNAL